MTAVDITAIQEFQRNIWNCAQCPLSDPLRSMPPLQGPMPFAVEPDGLPIMLVSDSPTLEEYRNGQPFSSSTGGQVLVDALRSAGFDHRQFIRTNCVKCHTPKESFEGNTLEDIVHCGSWLDDEIRLFKPKIVVVFGNIGIQRFYGDYYDRLEWEETVDPQGFLSKNIRYRQDWDEEAKKYVKQEKLPVISDKHSTIEWNTKYNCFVMYMYSPRYVANNLNKRDDFIGAFKKLKTFWDNGCVMPQEQIATDYTLIVEETGQRQKFLDEAKRFLKWVSTQPAYSVDLETTGFHWKNDRILLISYCWSPGRAVAIQWDDELYEELCESMGSPALKIMQNGRFDLKFFKSAGIKVHNFMFDTNIAAHLLDENSWTGLETLTVRYLGLKVYKSNFWEWIKGKNQADPAVMRKFAEYAAIDADYTFRLYLLFEKMLKNPDNLPEDKLHTIDLTKTPWNVFTRVCMPLTNVLAIIEDNGIHYDQAYMAELEKTLKIEAEALKVDLERKVYELVFPAPYEVLKSFIEKSEGLWESIYTYLTSPGQESFQNRLGVTEYVERVDVITGIQDKVGNFWAHVKAFCDHSKAIIAEGNNNEEYLRERLNLISQYLVKEEPGVTSTGKPKTVKSGAIPILKDIKTTLKRKGLKIEYLEECIIGLESFYDWVRKLVHHPFNPSSPKEVGHVIYNLLKMPVTKTTESGDPSTDKTVMEELAKQNPLCSQIQEYRVAVHDISNYIDAIRQATWMDGRVHPQFSQTRAVTGRLACSEPAMHGIKRIFRIRNQFIPAPMRLFIEADLSQAEVRMLAVLSGDENLMSVFLEGGDVHEANAKRIFNIQPGQKVTKEQRAATKRIVFAIVYGAHVSSVAEELTISVKEAQRLFDMFYQAYPKTRVWMDSMKRHAHEHLFVPNYYGRRRRLPTIRSPKTWEVREAERQVVNAPIQSSATADYVGLVHINLQSWIEEEHPDGDVLQIHNHHDAALIEAPIRKIIDVRRDVQRIGESADPTLNVKMQFDADIVACWGGSAIPEDMLDQYEYEYQNNIIPVVGYCDHIDEKTGKPCGNMFRPWGTPNKQCPDHSAKVKYSAA